MQHEFKSGEYIKKGKGERGNLRLPPQHMVKGIDFSTDCLHTTHFFMTAEQATCTSNGHKMAMVTP